MIVAVVTAIAITQREARREKAAREAEAAAAAKKDILIVGAGIHGLLVALFCRAQGFTVTIVDRKGLEHFKGDDRGSGGIVWLAPNALTVLERVHEKMPGYLKEAACGAEVGDQRERVVGLMRMDERHSTTVGISPANLSLALPSAAHPRAVSP